MWQCYMSVQSEHYKCCLIFSTSKVKQECTEILIVIMVLYKGWEMKFFLGAAL